MTQIHVDHLISALNKEDLEHVVAKAEATLVDRLIELSDMVENKEISASGAKEVFREIMKSDPSRVLSAIKETS